MAYVYSEFLAYRRRSTISKERPEINLVEVRSDAIRGEETSGLLEGRGMQPVSLGAQNESLMHHISRYVRGIDIVV